MMSCGVSKQSSTTAREEIQKSDTGSEVKYRRGNSTASLERAHVIKSIIYFIMHKGKAPIYKSSRSKAPKTQQICHYRHVRKTSGFFCCTELHQLYLPQ